MSLVDVLRRSSDGIVPVLICPSGNGKFTLTIFNFDDLQKLLYPLCQCSYYLFVLYMKSVLHLIIGDSVNRQGKWDTIINLST